MRMSDSKLKDLKISNLWSLDDRDDILKELDRSRAVETNINNYIESNYPEAKDAIQLMIKQDFKLTELTNLIKKLKGENDAQAND